MRKKVNVYKLAVSSADYLIARRRLTAAASILRNYLSGHPPRAGVLRRLGQICLSQGKPAEAAPLFEQALACHRDACDAVEPLAFTETHRRIHFACTDLLRVS